MYIGLTDLHDIGLEMINLFISFIQDLFFCQMSGQLNALGVATAKVRIGFKFFDASFFLKSKIVLSHTYQ